MERRVLLAQTFTVTNTLDDGSTGSLRWAINSVNADIGLGVDTIAFDIPGPGVHTIAVGSPLPVVGRPVAIDGYTQPGSSPNTLAVGDNAVLEIELDGSAAGRASRASRSRPRIAWSVGWSSTASRATGSCPRTTST